MIRSCARFALLVAFSALLAACGGATRVVYDNADTALLVMAEQYLDLEREQWKAARSGLERLHAWHRRDELPRYAALLDEAAKRFDRGLTPDDLRWAQETLRGRYRALTAAAVRESAPLLESLGPANRAALERKLASEHRKRTRELAADDPAGQERSRVRKAVKRAESWTGPLSATQKELFVRFVRATPDYPRLADAERRRKELELIQLLESAAETDLLAQRVEAHLAGWESDRDARFAAAAREREEHLLQLVLELDRMLTPTQRDHLRETLGRYAADARALRRTAL